MRKNHIYKCVWGAWMAMQPKTWKKEQVEKTVRASTEQKNPRGQEGVFATGARNSFHAQWSTKRWREVGENAHLGCTSKCRKLF